MLRFAKSLLAGAALLGLTASHAAALEPANASDHIQLFAAQNNMSEDCPYLPYHSGIFYQIGPDGDLGQPFVVPAGYVFVATSFHWRAVGDPQDPSVAGHTVYAGVRVGYGGPAREVNHYGAVVSSSIAGVNGAAGTSITLPTGTVLRPFFGGPICIILQQGNDSLIGYGYLNGYLAPDN